jgi:small subunit ribosomal protein S1
VGDSVSAVVKNVDVKNRKIRLSIKEMEAPSPSELPAAASYLNNRENVGSSLGLALADVKIEVKS